MARTAPHARALLFWVLAAWFAQTEACLAQQVGPTAPAPVPTAAGVAATATLRFLAVGHNGDPLAPLRAEELSLRIGNKPRKIVSLAPANDEPQTIGIFFDISGSRLFDNLIAQEVQSTSTFLESTWRPGTEGFIIDFADEPYTVTKPTTDLHHIQAALLTIPGKRYVGTTALYDALCTVPFGPQAANREKLFIVVSDFDDTASGNSMDQMVETMRDEGVRVFALLRPNERFDSPTDRRRAMKAAKKVTEKTGGDFFVVTDKKDLPVAFQRLASEWSGAYRLTYEASPAEGKRQKVELRTTRKDVDLLFPRD